MSEKRYVKVPVEFEHIGGGVVWARLIHQCDGRCDRFDVVPKIGIGATEDEAFTDLLKKLGYEEAR